MATIFEGTIEDHMLHNEIYLRGLSTAVMFLFSEVVNGLPPNEARTIKDRIVLFADVIRKTDDPATNASFWEGVALIFSHALSDIHDGGGVSPPPNLTVIVGGKLAGSNP